MTAEEAICRRRSIGDFDDRPVYLSDFPFICVDDYETFPDLVSELL